MRLGSVERTATTTRSREEDGTAKITRTIEVSVPVDKAFDYVADFSTTETWDPGIVEGRRVDDGPVGVGSAFDVVADFGGRRLPLRYRITEYERPSRVVLVGEGARFRGVDDIRFSPSAGGTRIDYLADLRLRGLARIAEPFMRGRFEQLSDDAIDGLSRTLSRKASQG